MYVKEYQQLLSIIHDVASSSKIFAFLASRFFSDLLMPTYYYVWYHTYLFLRWFQSSLFALQGLFRAHPEER